MSYDPRSYDRNFPYAIAKIAFITAKDHELLLKKLQIYGLNSNSLKWFESYLSGRYQKVCVDGKLSEPLGIQSGVPQGSNNNNNNNNNGNFEVAPPQSGYSSTEIRIELEFRNVGF